MSLQVSELPVNVAYQHETVIFLHREINHDGLTVKHLAHVFQELLQQLQVPVECVFWILIVQQP